MKKLLSILVLAGCALTAQAQSTAPADDSVYQAFGGEPGLTKLMDDFVNRLKVDPRIGSFFKDANVPNLKAQLTAQLCVVSGGPCKYSGADMKSAHADMGIDKSNFNALVEVLQVSMDAQGIPFRAQNQMLARLAPMHRDIIEK